jgi:WD40 repeat protein
LSEPIIQGNSPEKFITAVSTKTSQPLSRGGDSARNLSPKNLDRITLLTRINSPSPGEIRDIAWSPDGSLLAAAGKNGLLLLNGSTLEITQTIDNHISVAQINFSADGNRLAGVDPIQWTAEIWDVKSGKSLGIIQNTGYRVGLSANGKLLAAVSEEMQINESGNFHNEQTTIKLFDVDSGSQLFTMTGNTGVSMWNTTPLETIGLFFSQDGQRLQSVTNFGDVHLWDIKNGKLLSSSLNYFTRERLSSGLCQADGRGGGTFSTACYISYLDPPCTEDDLNCNPIAASRYDIGLWSSGEVKRYQITTIKEFAGESPAFSVNSDGSRFVLLDWHGEIFIREKSKPEPLARFTSVQAADWIKQNKIGKIAHAPFLELKPGEGSPILASARNGNIQLLDAKGGVQAEFSSSLKTISSAQLVDGIGGIPGLLIGYSDGSLQLMDLERSVPIKTIPKAHDGIVSQVDFDFKNNRVISSGTDGVIRYWDMEDPALQETMEFKFALGSFGWQHSFAFHPERQILAFLTKEKSDASINGSSFHTNLINTITGQTVLTLNSTTTPFTFSRDGNWIASGDFTLSLWNAQSGELLREFTAPPESGRINAASLNNDGSLIAAVRMNRVQVLDVNSQDTLLDVSFDSFPVHIEFSPDDCLLAVGERSGQVSVINMESRRVESQWWEHAGSIHDLDFSPDGRIILTSGEDGSVNLHGLDGSLDHASGSTPEPGCRLASPPQTSTPVTPSATITPAPPTLTATPFILTRKLLLTDPPMSGNDIYLLQDRLKKLGYTSVGTPDGVFGPMTDKAVRQFQQEYGLETDGIVGPLTWHEIFTK